MDQQNLLGLMALGDAFGSLGAIGGGNPGPQRALPFAIQMGQEQEKRQRAMDALRAAGINVGGGAPTGGTPGILPPGDAAARQPGGMGGLPSGANPALLAAYGELNPDALLSTLVEAQINPRQPPAAPAAIQEYQFAQQQGFSGSYEDFIRRKSELTRSPEQPPAAPAAIQEYQFAQQQGFSGSYEDFIRRKSELTRSPEQPPASPIAALEARADAAGLAPGSEERRLFMLRGGAAGPTTDPIAALRARAEEAGLIPGTPEYREFMANSGSAADPIATLRARAAEAGLQPGTRGYENFMLRGGPAPEIQPADTFDQAGKLRDDFRAEPAFKVFSDVQDAARRIGMFYQNPGAVSDYGLAVAFAKIVDPGSVAREGEVAAVQRSGALSESMKQSLINAINGEGALPPQMREEIVNLAEGFYKEQAQKYQQTYNEYQGRAERFGIDPRDALPDPLQSLSLRPVTPVDRLPDLLRGSPPTMLRHPDTGETIYWDGTKIAPVPQ